MLRSQKKRKLEAYGSLPTDDDVKDDELKGCTIMNVLDNYGKNLFHVMSKVSNLIETLKDFPA